jgi:Holliday junction DNA helicase RuvB
LETNVDGLGEMDKKILFRMGQKDSGCPVGSDTVAVAVGEDRQTVDEVHQSYLITAGYIQRIAQERVRTSNGWEKVALEQMAIQEQFQISEWHFLVKKF